MRARFGVAVLLLGAALGIGCKAGVPGTKSREVRGRVVRATDSKLVVSVGAEQWEVAVAPGTSIPSELAEGRMVAIEFAMTAKKVTVVPEPAVPPTPARRPRTPRPGMPPTDPS